jgi:serine/threonine-protein kinase
VHRDLKPANVLLGDDGARLADFGIARFEAEMLAGTMVTRLTETAAVLGTLPYMSPEQRRGGAIDRRSDLFSAGVMLYEAATGAVPQARSRHRHT